MNLNNHHMFDELVKQKLEDYSETPDMQLMQRIHTKKNRINNWYGLYRILIIASAIGLGILGTYMLGGLYNQEAKVDKTPNKVYQVTTPAASESAVNADNNKSSRYTPIVVTSTNNSVNNQYAITSKVSQNGYSSQKATHKATISSPIKNNQKLDEFARQTSTSSQQIDSKTAVDPKLETTTKIKISKAAAYCKSVFNYFASFNGDINFSNFSEGDNALTYVWNFGDGSSSQQSSPTHSYKREGEYTVQLTVKDDQGCEHSDYKTIVYKSNTSKNAVRSTLKGVVKAGNNPVANALVEFYSATTEDVKGYYLVKTNINGEFTLGNLLAGRYILRATPTDNTPNYLVTYWGNQSDYNNAPEVVVTQTYDEHLIGYSIDLAYKGPDIVTPNAPPIGDNTDHQVLFLDANNKVVGTGTMDANGKVTAQGDLNGNFKVLDKQSGMVTGSIDLGGSNNQGSSGILHTPSTTSTMTLNPNPATNFVNINLQAVQGDASSVMVIDSKGTIMYSTELSLGIGSTQVPIDISNLSGGVYYVVLKLKSGGVISTRLMKSDAQEK